MTREALDTIEDNLRKVDKFAPVWPGGTSEQTSHHGHRALGYEGCDMADESRRAEIE